MFLKYNSTVRFIKVGKFSIPAGIWHEALKRGIKKIYINKKK